MKLKQLGKLLSSLSVARQSVRKSEIYWSLLWKLRSIRYRYTSTAFTIAFPIVNALSFAPKPNVINNLIKVSDELFEEAQYEESFKVLSNYKDSDNVEILWRLSRGLYNMKNEQKATGAVAKALIEEADQYIHKALSIDDGNYAVHKWFAIILDAKTSIEGTKAKIASLPTFKYHIERAIELNPKDATSIHMLGTYYYNIANLPWYQKKVASALFGKVPDATFQEALSAFSKAEEISPNFYSLNLLMLGKTCLQLGMKDSGRHWLQRASTFLVKTEEDKLVQKEAMELLLTL